MRIVALGGYVVDNELVRCMAASGRCIGGIEVLITDEGRYFAVATCKRYTTGRLPVETSDDRAVRRFVAEHGGDGVGWYVLEVAS